MKCHLYGVFVQIYGIINILTEEGVLLAMTYYENLRVIREDRGYTQKQIAAVLETTQQYYSDYENGKREIPIRVYIALSKFYNVSIDFLAGMSYMPVPYSGSNAKAGVG